MGFDDIAIRTPFSNKARAKRLTQDSGGSNDAMTTAAHSAGDLLAEFVWLNAVDDRGGSGIVINAMLSRDYPTGTNPVVCKFDLYLYQYDGTGATLGDPYEPIDSNVIPIGIIRFEGTSASRVLTDGSAIDHLYIPADDFAPFSFNTEENSKDIYGALVAVDAITLAEVDNVNLELSLAF